MTNLFIAFVIGCVVGYYNIPLLAWAKEKISKLKFW